MPIASQSLMPSISDVMELVRSIVNDTFPGIAGQQGRVFTDDAPFTLPFLNSALRTLQRKLRNGGVTFPDKDNVILSNLTPVVTASTSVQIYVGYNGYFDGTTLHPTPKLPNDLMQPYVVWEQQANSGLAFAPMQQVQEGLPSTLQGPFLGLWEWRDYKICMIGSSQTKNLRLKYKSGQPPINVPPASFSATAINIIDCQEAVANYMAALYGKRNGAADVSQLEQTAEDAVDDMISEWVRRSQTVNYSRIPYNGGGGTNGTTGQSGQIG